ncbi:quinon protein alcohol dehydrogenase-like superfamily, partial [Colletotrichum acutatum]
IDVSHNSEKIAASYNNLTTAIWTVTTGHSLQLLSMDRALRGSFVSFSPNPEIVATLSVRGGVHLWEVSTGVCLRAFDTNGPVVSQLAFVSDTNLLIVKEADGEIRTLDIDTGRWTSRASGGEVTRGPVAFSHDSKLIA